MDYQLAGAAAPGFDKVVLLAPLVRAAWNGAWYQVAYWVGQNFLERVPRRFAANSNDKDFLQFLEHDDPLQTRYVSVRWVDAMLRWESRFDYFEPTDKPTLLLQGQRDSTVDWRYNIPLIRKKFPKAKYTRCRMPTTSSPTKIAGTARENFRGNRFCTSAPIKSWLKRFTCLAQVQESELR